MQIENDEYNQTKQEKKEGIKTTTIIAVLITATIIAVIVIICLIISMQEDELTVVIDEVSVNVPSDTFIFTDNGDIYVSIKDIAAYVGYESHNGEYKIDVEDTNKMYVEATDGTETTSFFLNSTTISKVAPDTTDDYEDITISEPVSLVNDKMYIIDTGFTVAFNSLFYYDSTKNQIIIQTLPYLVTAYSEVIENYGYYEISEDFNNQKALIYGMIVASKESNGKYGVISTDGTEILSPRYNNIEFIESNGEFIITNSSSKVGIAYSTGKTKITVSYDDIEVMDSSLGLYLVKSNNKYGVIDSSETTIIHIEYDQIGIDTSTFSADNIKNQYILYDTIIPVKINNKWRLFDTSGNRLTTEEYDAIGFEGTNQRNSVENNALTIGETGTIVVGINEQYGGVDVKGNTLIPIRFEAIYSLTSAGSTVYYILYEGVEYNAEEYINAMKEALGYEEDQNEMTSVTNNNTEENTTTDETNQVTPVSPETEIVDYSENATTSNNEVTDETTTETSDEVTEDGTTSE